MEKGSPKKFKNRYFLILITIGVLFIAFVIQNKYNNLLNKSNEFNKKIKSLEDRIEYESERADELKEQKEYTKSKEYIEELARDRMGLIGENEILIVPK